MAAVNFSSCYLQYARKPPGKAYPVLWPVLIHKILYPEIKSAKLNLFKKVVLQLIRAQHQDTQEQAQLTGLHPDLILLIKAQLISNDWVTNDAKALTESGKDLLSDEDAHSERLCSGYLFQDALTGKVWPRLTNKRPYIEPVNPDEELPSFNRDRKTGKKMTPFLCRINKANWPEPKQKELQIAWQEHKQDQNSATQLHGYRPTDTKLRISGMRYQEQSAEPAYILLWVSPGMNTAPLSIKDPFDIRDEAWWLQDQSVLSVLLEKNPKLKQDLARLIGQPDIAEQSYQQWLDNRNQQIEFELLSEYPWLTKEPDLAYACSVLLKRRVSLHEDKVEHYEPKDAISDCQKLLEVLMQWLIKKFPADTTRLPKENGSHQSNKGLLQALDLPAFKENICRTLAGQNLKMVLNNLSAPSSSLKGLLFSAALGTVGHDDHPLKQLSAEQLQLEKLLKLANLRNKASHGSSRYTGKDHTEITVEMAQDNIEYTLHVTEQFKEWINGKA